MSFHLCRAALHPSVSAYLRDWASARLSCASTAATIFENNRAAAYVQRAYAVRVNLHGLWADAECWGITASDGPGAMTRRIDGCRAAFFR